MYLAANSEFILNRLFGLNRPLSLLMPGKQELSSSFFWELNRCERLNSELSVIIHFCLYGTL